MFDKVKEVIAKQLNIDVSKVTKESSFQDDLHADSLDLFEMVMSMEDEFSVEIPTDDLKEIKTVGALVDYLEKKGIKA